MVRHASWRMECELGGARALGPVRLFSGREFISQRGASSSWVDLATAMETRFIFVCIAGNATMAILLLDVWCWIMSMAVGRRHVNSP